MSPRHRAGVDQQVDQQVTLVDRLWIAALLVVAFADVIAVLYVLPLFD